MQQPYLEEHAEARAVRLPAAHQRHAYPAQLAGARNIPVIVNIHNVELARRFAARIVGMSGGAVRYDGPPEGLTDDHLKQIYGGEGWLE